MAGAGTWRSLELAHALVIWSLAAEQRVLQTAEMGGSGELRDFHASACAEY